MSRDDELLKEAERVEEAGGLTPVPPTFPVRVWAALAILNLAAALLTVPFARELLAQTSRVSPSPGLVVTQAVLIYLPAAALGLRLGRPLGLGAPLLGAWFEHRADRAMLTRSLGTGALAGLALGAVLLTSSALNPLIEAELARLGAHMPEHPSALAGVLVSFGAGISEETLVRLFLLTALYRLAFASRGVTGLSTNSAFWIANVVSALVFGALHFGNVLTLGVPLTALLASSALFFNGIVGLTCGALFRSRGIESAMAAHVATDLVIHGLAPALGRAP